MSTEHELRHDFMEKVEAFWDKVDRGDPDECWEWAAATSGHGYGCFSIDSANWERAHRVMAAMTGSSIDGEQVHHECDNPSCINPNHLYIGEQHENTADMVLRGRHEASEGAENGKAVLTADDVREIRNSDANYKMLAEKYGTTPQNIGSIVRRETWQHVELVDQGGDA